MNVKQAILSIYDKDDLKQVIDELEVKDVDRRSVQTMRAKLSRSRRATPEVLLGRLQKDGLKQVCSELGLPTKGKKDELVHRVLNGNGKQPKQESKNSMSQATAKSTEASKETAAVERTKKPEKLTLARLERKLFEACDILRGNMDASEFKEYIFGMLFLKRLSDQFDHDREALRKKYEKQGMRADLIKKQIENPDKYDFYVPPKAHWSKIKHLKETVGSGLNKALEEIEDRNIDTLEDVLKGINFNRKVGQRTMDDDTLVEFIQHFNEIPLSNDDFDFPDLLGSAYEYLIKYFADSAGKKGGEFYTPGEVVRMMVQLIEPEEGMGVYDPCVGSGGMLIQSMNYIEERGGNARNLSLCGQELNGGTWSICKMNMILHGIRSADIRQGDTIKNPMHLDKKGEVRRFQRVIANPPFSQNYTKKEMKFPERFQNFMPEKGKKADLMFVQHMVSSLTSDGKMAVVMPHGVLFRGGEEKECRKRFITEGVLEAVIGLPPGLFYGTGIPACVLVINKAGAQKRDSVLFINADAEFLDAKNQASLRPEDIEKITHVYHNRLKVEKYAREVKVSELKTEDYNLNIRRFVDNSPAPEPHDVRAHLNGGVPLTEIDALKKYFGNYKGVRELLFRPQDDHYRNFADAIEDKGTIKTLIESAIGVQKKHSTFHAALDAWWAEHVDRIEDLPNGGNVFDLKRELMGDIAETLLPQKLLTANQLRGALAGYFDRRVKVGEYINEKGKTVDITTTVTSDLQAIVATGWNAELIPEGDILQSQFPEVLKKAQEDQARIVELEALFDAADDEDDEDDEESGVLPSDVVKECKTQRGELKNKSWEKCEPLAKRVSELVKKLKTDKVLPRSAKVSDFKTGLTKSVQDFEAANKILCVPGLGDKYEKFTRDIERLRDEGLPLRERIDQINAKLARHEELASELRKKKAGVKQVEKQKDELVAKAREKITTDDAKELILERLQRLLSEQFNSYLEQYRDELVSEVENLWGKYAVTIKDIIKARDRDAAQLNKFLKELGYE